MGKWVHEGASGNQGQVGPLGGLFASKSSGGQWEIGGVQKDLAGEKVGIHGGGGVGGWGALSPPRIRGYF